MKEEQWQSAPKFKGESEISSSLWGHRLVEWMVTFKPSCILGRVLAGWRGDLRKGRRCPIQKNQTNQRGIR